MKKVKNTRYLPDFLTIPCVLIKNKKLQSLDHLVYGIIYWYTKMKLEKCIASNQTIADHLSATPGAVSNSLSRLSKNKYIKIIFEKETKKRVRLEIIPLIVFAGRSDVPSVDGTCHQLMEQVPSVDVTNVPSADVQNKKIYKEEDILIQTALSKINSNGEEKKAPAKRLLGKPYSKMDWLTNIGKDDIVYFQERFPNLSESMIHKEAKKSYWWLRNKETVRKDYRGFLRNWLEKTSESWGNNNENESRRVRHI